MSDQPTELLEEPTTARNNLPLLLGVLAGVVALAALYLFVVQPLLAGDDAVVDDPAPPAAPADTDATIEGEEAVDLDALELVPAVTYEVFLSRDPFDPVVPEPAPSASPTSTDGASDGDGDTDGTDPADDGNDGTDGATDGDAGSQKTATDGCRGEGEVVCDGRMVSLLEVGRDDDGNRVAVIQVDTTVYEVQRGDTFAGAFQLRAIDGSCVSVLHGDDGFQLCTGDRVLK